jgi:hypothetical protein
MPTVGCLTMPERNRAQSEEQQAGQIEEASLATWRHPVDEIEPESGQDTYLALLGGNTDAADIFRRLFVMCLPPRTYSDLRHVRGAYHRMVALAFTVAPEVFEGRTAKTVAQQLGITPRCFMDHLAEVARMMRQRREAAVKATDGL